MQYNESPPGALIGLADARRVAALSTTDDDFLTFLLASATAATESYCLRRFLYRKHRETFAFYDDAFPLSEYPVRYIAEVQALKSKRFIPPTNYDYRPLTGGDFPLLFRLNDNSFVAYGEALRVTYTAGYTAGKVPPDLKNAVIELAVWNKARIESDKVGHVYGSRASGEYLENTMPENVKSLLEAYRRKII
jgi:hypothetical protein